MSGLLRFRACRCFVARIFFGIWLCLFQLRTLFFGTLQCLIYLLLHPAFHCPAVLWMLVVFRFSLDCLRESWLNTLLHNMGRFVSHQFDGRGILIGPQPDMVSVG